METDMAKAQWYEQQVESLRNEKQECNDIPNNLSHTGGSHYDVRLCSNED